MSTPSASAMRTAPGSVRTLKPMITPDDARASITSDSLILPVPVWMTRTRARSEASPSSACWIASRLPCTSAFSTTFSSLARPAATSLGNAASVAARPGAAPPQRARAHDRRGQGPARRVELRLDDRALGGAVRVRLELGNLGDEEDVLQQVLEAVTRLGRYGVGDDVAAPLLDQQLPLRELLLDAVLVGVRQG